ncbi:MAG: triose-phosphate isomerase [Candidatus Paceibacterota bacterium]|jgi:triosephosphate isomerase
MSKKIIIGNWKMNPSSLRQAEDLFKSIQKTISYNLKIDVVICPPYVYLERLKKLSKKVALGAQNVSWQEKGAFTGEISAEMLKDIGVKYVILGHSERRVMDENNIDINKKTKMAFSFNLIPILCIGEKERDENHEYLNFIKKQIEECLAGVIKNSISKIIIAYEPVWAIGKGAIRQASPEEFREMRIFIKKVLSDKFGAKIVEKVKIIYGGSVHKENAVEFLKENADGFLVGRDSLDSKKFTEIIKICEA